MNTRGDADYRKNNVKNRHQGDHAFLRLKKGSLPYSNPEPSLE